MSKVKEITDISRDSVAIEERLIALAAWMKEQYGGTMKKRKEKIHLKKKGKDSELTITLPRYSGVLLKLTTKA